MDTQGNRQMNLPKDTTPVNTPPSDHITELKELSNIQHKFPEFAFISLRLQLRHK
jgi:hypothetical protein